VIHSWNGASHTHTYPVLTKSVTGDRAAAGTAASSSRPVKPKLIQVLLFISYLHASV
jgi:hypothetical protein